MKILILTLLLVISNFSIALDIQHWQTTNGAKVYFVEEKTLPMLDVQLTFDAASSRDGDLYGIAKLTNNLIGTGTNKYNEEQIIDLFDSLGAEYSNSSLKDMSLLNLRTLTKKDVLNDAIALFYNLINKPKFDEKIINRLKKQSLRSIEASLQSPAAIARKALSEKIFKNHPYAHQSIGNKKTLTKITKKNIVNFYHKYYVSNNLTIALIGDISREQAEKISEKLSSGLESGIKAKQLANTREIKTSSYDFIKFPSKQSHLLIGHNGIKRSAKNYYALYLGNHIFGGSGLSSILSKEIREKRGLSYSAYSYFIPMKYNGYFLLNLQTKNTSVEEARSVSKKELNKFIQQKPTEQSIKDAKDNLIGGFALNIASNAQILTYLSLIGFYDLPLDYLSSFINNIKKVTSDDIYKAYQKLFTNKVNLIEIVVGAKS